MLINPAKAHVSHRVMHKLGGIGSSLRIFIAHTEHPPPLRQDYNWANGQMGKWANGQMGTINTGSRKGSAAQHERIKHRKEHPANTKPAFRKKKVVKSE